MSKFAVIATGGKQYIVKENDTLKIEKIKAQKGEVFVFDKVLLIWDNESGDIKIGQPFVPGAKVEAKILEQGRDKKIRVVKYKPKTRYHKVYGHRQPYTKVKINKFIYPPLLN